MRRFKFLAFILLSSILLLLCSCSSNTYVLSFELNNGQTKATRNTDRINESSIIAPTKDGYVFGGWHLDNEFSEKVTFPYALKADTCFYAKWDKAFTVTFVNYDDTVLKTEKVGEGKGATPPDGTPQKPSTAQYSYMFSSWDKAFHSITEDITIKALFNQEAIEYTIAFIYNDATGSNTVASKKVKYGEAYGELPTPTKRDYVFEGWYKESELTTAVSETTVFTGELADWLYARFTCEGKTVYSISNYDIIKEETASIICYFGTQETLFITDVLDGTNITKLINLNNATLKEVTLPIGITSIEADAFNGCSALTSLTVYENEYFSAVDGVLFNADKTELIRFPRAKNITSYTLPDTVTKINSNAFNNCTKLTKLIINKTTPPDLGESVFENSNLFIYVAQDVLNTYETDSKWQAYADIIEAVPSVGEGFFPYVQKFTSDNITILSEEELLAYIEFISFYRLSDSDTTNKTVNIAYTENFSSENFSEICKLSTFAANSGLGYSSSSSEYKFYVAKDYANIEASITAADKNKYTQLGHVLYNKINPERASNFDNFKINNTSKTVEVITSNQLVYALEHSYQPLPVSGSDAEKMYIKAKAVLRTIITDDMSDYEKVKAIYMWLVMEVAYDFDALNFSDKWWEYDAYYLEGVFNNGRAVCDGISKAFVVLSNIEGIPSVRVTGQAPEGGHAWNKVLVNATWYIADATWGGGLLNDYENLDFEDFLITQSKKEEQKCIAYNYNEILANTEFNFYDYTNLTISNHNFDLLIDSAEELSYVLEYYLNYRNIYGSQYEKISIEFKLNPDIFESTSILINSAITIYENRNGSNTWLYKDGHNIYGTAFTGLIFN